MKKYLTIIIIVIVVAGIAFYAGMKYGAGQAASGVTALRGNAQGVGNLFSRGNFTGSNGLVSGQVLSLEPQGFTVKLRDGSSRIILAASSTAVMKSVAGALSDIASGVEVTVIGTANSDGSLTAQSVQIRPTQFNQVNQ